jgi:Kip1 ubiquitination-promoting complex protein 1
VPPPPPPQDPVILPDSRITVDRPTIERHLLSSGTDPFSRAPLSAEQLLPDEALAARIHDWLLAHGGDAALSPH